jgi:cytoskeletal protein RodZ
MTRRAQSAVCQQMSIFGPHLASKRLYMLNQECTPMDASQLAAEARAAYEQRRTRECIALTRALAQADPENEVAQALQSAIRADIQQDLRDARGLLEQSGSHDEKKKYRKAAEIILLKTLNLDPENEEARVLLQSARAMSGVPQVVTQARPDEIPFVAAPPLGQKKEKKRRFKIPFTLIAILVLGGALLLILKGRKPSPLAASVSRESFNRTESTRPPVPPPYAPVPTPVSVTSTPQPAPVATPAVAPKPVTAAPPEVATATPAAPATNAATNVPAASEMGKLSVTSPTPAEIYLGNRYLGSTPTTLQLPVGRQTLEYRHGELRTVVTHTIKPNTTTTTSVTFQMTVQINARPWAQVSLEGSPRRSLGQTPLSGVVAPIGGVLVFENPNFPTKSYRITDTDSAIQVNFP